MELNWQSIIISIITSGVITTILNFIFDRIRHRKEIQKEKHMRGFHDKIVIYRMIIDLIADFLNDFNFYILDKTPIPENKIYAFNNLRMRTFGYLCIYADQESIDAHEELIEYIYDVLEKRKEGEWPEVRNRALRMLNSFRMDYDSNLIPAQYNGNR